jgi:hypothetical protein
MRFSEKWDSIEGTIDSLLLMWIVTVDAQNKVARGRQWRVAAGCGGRQYQNIVGTTPRGAAQSYDIIVTRRLPLPPAAARMPLCSVHPLLLHCINKGG